MEMREHGWEFKVGVENMIAPKGDSMNLGYSVSQMKHLLGNTKNIGINVDSGHRLLSDEMSVAELFGIAPIVSLHFHTNPGIFHEEGYDDDAHKFATAKTLEHFNSYIRSARRFETPIVCEISSLSNVPDKQIQSYVGWLQFLLK